MKNIRFNQNAMINDQAMQEIVLNQVRTLTMTDRLAVFLHFYQGVNSQVIADIVGQPTYEVRGRLVSTLIQISVQLSKQGVHLNPNTLARCMADTPEPEVPASLIDKIEQIVQCEAHVNSELL